MNILTKESFVPFSTLAHKGAGCISKDLEQRRSRERTAHRVREDKRAVSGEGAAIGRGRERGAREEKEGRTGKY